MPDNCTLTKNKKKEMCTFFVPADERLGIQFADGFDPNAKNKTTVGKKWIPN